MSKGFLYPGTYNRLPQFDAAQADCVLNHPLDCYCQLRGTRARVVGWSDEPTFAVLRTDEVQERLAEREEER